MLEGLRNHGQLWASTLTVAFAATCWAVAQGEFVSSARSVAWWMVLYFGQFALLAGAWGLRRHIGRRMVLGTALLFRLLLLPAGLRSDASWTEMPDGTAWNRFLVFDHDVWRFLWDGHVGNAGKDPWAHAPAAAEMDGLAESDLWTAVRERLNYPTYHSVYPPGAQALFRLMDALLPGTPLGPKLISVLSDLAIVALLPGEWALLYAWNPLALKAGAASGHIDSVVGLLILLAARGNGWRGALWWAGAAAVKLSPLVLWPWVGRMMGWRAAALGLLTFGLVWLPYASELAVFARAFGEFAGTWQFNAPLLLFLPRWALTMLCGAWIFYMLWRSDLGRCEQAAWALCGLVLLSPAVMPWYLLWALPVSLAGRLWGPLFCTIPMGLAMLVMIDGRESVCGLVVEIILLGVILGVTFPWRSASGMHEDANRVIDHSGGNVGAGQRQ
jgi:hypothetical protein